MTFRDHPGLYGQKWERLSLCGRYAIRLDNSDPRNTRFEALHVPGVWASAHRIGVRNTLAKAESLCEQHSLAPATAKHVSLLAAGV